MLAELCFDPNTGRGDPVRLTAALKLTFYQIRQILYAERDRDGVLIVRDKGPADGLTDEERFTQIWLRRCLPRWRIAKKWREQIEQVAREQEQIEKRGLNNGHIG